MFLILFVLALLGGFTYEQIGRARDASEMPPRVGQAIDIGGRTLNLDCSGQGSPTVILEPGGNSPGYEQLLLQSKVAESTRACWYDRAGVGWSDPPSSPRPVFCHEPKLIPDASVANWCAARLAGLASRGFE